MSIKIEINIPDDEVGQGQAALDKHIAVLGYMPNRTGAWTYNGPIARNNDGTPKTDSDDEEMRAVIRAGMAHGQLLASANNDGVELVQLGKDDERVLAQALVSSSEFVAPIEKAAEQPKEEPKKTRTRKTKAEEPQIRTNPENRVEAEAGDDEATAAQDEADEQAEVEATRAPETPVTIDDLKKVVGEYLNAFRTSENAERGKPGSGWLEAQEDGPKIFRSVLGDREDGSPWTFQNIPQEKLAKVVNAWKSAVAEATTSKKRFGA